MNDSSRSRLIKLAHVASLVRQLRTVDGIGDFMQKSAYGYYQTPQQARTAARVQQLVQNKEERHAKAREAARWRQARAYMNHERILSYREAIAAAKKGDRTLLEEHLRKEHMGYWDPQSPYYSGGGFPGQQGEGGQEASVPAQEPVASTPVATPPSAPAPPAPPLPGDESSLRYYQGDGQWNFPEGTSQAQMDAAKQMQQNVDEYSSAIEKYNAETGNPIQNVEAVQVTKPDGTTEYEIRGDAQTNWLNEVNSGADAIARGEPPEWLGGTTDQNLPEADMNAGTGRTDEPVKPHGVTPLPSQTQSQAQSQAQTAPGTSQTQTQSAPTASTTPSESTATTATPSTTASSAATPVTPTSTSAPGTSAVQSQQAATVQRQSTPKDPNKLRNSSFLHRDGFQVNPGDMAAEEEARLAPAQQAMFQQIEQENKRNSPADPQLNTYQYWAKPNPVTNAFNKANPTAKPSSMAGKARRPARGTGAMASAPKPGPAAGVGSSMSSPGSAPLGGGPVGPQPINWNKRVNVPGITNKKKMNKPAPLE